MNFLKKTLLIITFFSAVMLFPEESFDVKENNIIDIAVSNNKQIAYAYYEKKEGMISTITEYFVKFEDKVLGPYDDIKPIYFINDSKSIMFMAQKSDGVYVCTEKSEVGPFTDYGELIRSNNQGVIGYLIGGYYVINGEKKYGPYEKIIDSRITPNEKIVCLVEEHYNEYYIYVNGKKSERFYRLPSYWLTDDKILYMGDVNSAKPNESRNLIRKIFINGKEEGINPSSIYFSPSKQNYAYTVNIAGKNYLCTAKEKFGPFNSSLNNIEILNITDNEILYSIKKENIYDIYVNNKNYGEFPTKNIVFSNDGKKIAYIHNNYVISENEKFGPSYGISDLCFLPDNKTLTYTIKINYEYGDSNQYLCIGKEKVGPFNHVENIVFSNDGTQIAFIATIDEGTYIFNNKERIGPYNDVIYLTFLSNGNLFYLVKEVNSSDMVSVYNGSGKIDIPISGTFSYIEDFEILKTGSPFFSIKYGAVYGNFIFYYNNEISKFLDVNQIINRQFINEKIIFLACTNNGECFLNFGNIKTRNYQHIDKDYIISDDKKTIHFCVDSYFNLILKDGKEYLGSLSNNKKVKAWLEDKKIFIE